MRPPVREGIARSELQIEFMSSTVSPFPGNWDTWRTPKSKTQRLRRAWPHASPLLIHNWGKPEPQ